MRDRRDNTVCRRIRVRGLVQGVGFRPHVWHIAQRFGVTGRVLNDGDGVEIAAWSGPADLDRFVDTLRVEAPPLARIDDICVADGGDGPRPEEFVIVESSHGTIATGVVADAATCSACLGEIFDAGDRRHDYAFANCTHCGPRLSIINGIPYDRAMTSMDAFDMCRACRSEYDDPADRRFHAQPNACPDCGPRLWLEDDSGEMGSTDPIADAARLIAKGAIIAIKGIGGFHLACDATDNDIVYTLRNRKKRYAKPLAVMVRDLEMAARYCRVSKDEATMLTAPSASIVLLAAAGEAVAETIAPGHDNLGVMLPYTPLHHLLMARIDRPIVLTSGNLSDEPQAIDNEDARARLAGIADYWLCHDRGIVNRLDDSVVRLDAPGLSILRRARGLAPEPILLHEAFQDSGPVLAMGGELKSTFCLLRGRNAVLSQHMGDLEEAATHGDFRNNLALYQTLFAFEPRAIVVDSHPDYLSTQWGVACAKEAGIPVFRAQHHHAHLAACLAEHAIAPDDDRSVGIILDGLGLGEDGTIWGGEFLLGGYGGFERVGHFDPVALPGGAMAVREPWRNAYAHLRHAFGADALDGLQGTKFGALLRRKPLETIDRMIERGVNSPASSSAGRLFDAVAAMIGVCIERQAYEGQAAMELEALARPSLCDRDGYPIERRAQNGRVVLTWSMLWRRLLADLTRGVEPALIAARFHLGLCEAIADAAVQIAENHQTRRIILSGGVMQNRIVLEDLFARLKGMDLDVLVHRLVPANDGGLALGQSAIGAWLSNNGQASNAD